MQLHPGRILGIVMGLVILATIFFIQFNHGDTLYNIVWPSITNLSQLQSTLGTSALTYTYIWIVAFILLVIAGIVGLFPLGTGVLGVVGMALITVSPYLVYPNGQVTLSPDIGFYVIWAASIVSLGASFWHGKKKEAATPVTVNVTQSQVVGAPSAQAETVSCPNCGAPNAITAAICVKCGKDLPVPK